MIQYNITDNLFTILQASFADKMQRPVFNEVVDNQIQATSYSDFLVHIKEIQFILTQYNLPAGSRIAILGTTSKYWIIAYLACLASNYTVVCLDPALNSAQLYELMDRTNTQLLLTDSAIFAKLNPDFSDLYQALDLRDKLKKLNVPIKNRECDTNELDPSIASILFTSGTTGGFKGVILEHKALHAAIRLAVKSTESSSTDRVLCLLPAHHIYALVCVILSPLLAGASLIFVEKLEGPYILKSMQLGKPTIIVGVPRIYELLTGKVITEINSKPYPIRTLIKFLIQIFANIRKFTGLNLGKSVFKKVNVAFGGNIKKLMSGGAPLSTATFNILYGLGFVILEGYGLTETSASIILNPLNKQKAGSVGKPMEGIELKLNAPDSTGLGEICVRSPTLMRGYYHDEDSTTQSLREGWYHTGDLGTLDNQGYLYINGRIKELIVLSNGKKIAPSYIESVITDIEHVDSLGVVGVVNDNTGAEEIHLAVTIDNHALQKIERKKIENEIIKSLQTHMTKLPPWCQISQIHFVDGIPKTSTLKIKRSELVNILKTKEANYNSAKNISSMNEMTELEHEVIQIMKSIDHNLNQKALNGKSSFQFDVGFDSIQIPELIEKIAQKYHTKIEADKIATLFRIDDLISLIQHSKKTDHVITSDQAIFMTENELKPIRAQFLKLTDYHGIQQVIFNRISAFILVRFSKFFDFSCSGLENISSNTAYIIAANHCSHLDNLSLSTAMLKINKSCAAAAAKDYFFKSTFFSILPRLILKIFPFERKTDFISLKENVAYMQLCKESQLSVLVYPEGTRSLTGQMAEFKHGVALMSDILDYQVIPAYIEGTYACLPKGKWLPKRGKITVTFGKPISFHRFLQNIEANNPNDIDSKAEHYKLFSQFLKSEIIKLKNHE